MEQFGHWAIFLQGLRWHRNNLGFRSTSHHQPIHQPIRGAEMNEFNNEELVGFFLLISILGFFALLILWLLN